jgi:beta-glucosidase
VKNGKLDIKDVDRNVRRMLEYIVKTPSFRNYPASNSPDFKAHAAITRQSAAEGIVLLKNGPHPASPRGGEPRLTLPLGGDGEGLTVALFGEKSYDFLSGGTGSGCVHPPYVVDMLEGLKNAGIASTPTLTNIYRKYIEYAKVKFQAERHPAKWYQMEMFGQQKYPEIAISPIAIDNEAKAADAAIITIGRQAGEGVDRDIDTEFNLIPEERALITDVCNAFHAAGKPVIVIINSGSVIETASWSSYPDAILCAWQPGMEGGNSIADLLTGKVNPSGKLTMTWPIAATDHPSTKNFPGSMDSYTFEMLVGQKAPIPGHTYTNHEEDIYVGYRYFDTFGKPVAYPFGYGLSYTTFAFSNFKAKELKDGSIEVTVAVKNTGSVSGKEVAQVYVTAPQGTLQKPAQELKSFAKTRDLKPGESQTLTMRIAKRDLASFDEAGSRWLAEAGTYTFRVGASSRDIAATATLQLKEYTEPVNNVMKPQQSLNLLR